MRSNNEIKLCLAVDRDDVTVKSSPEIQKIVNAKTNFKTEVLEMFEQLNRNCSYFLGEVMRDPFSYENWISVNTARYYVTIANMFLNQFLEERDTFLEIDNMPKGSRKYFNYDKEMDLIIKYSELIDKNRTAFHAINVFCLNRAEKIIYEAKKNHTIPKFGALVSMDSNDIIKMGSIDEAVAMDYILYKKPLEKLINCIKNENRIEDIITNARVFFQPSQEIVDYSKIHSIENVNWEAVGLVEELIHSGLISYVYESSHHNGDRENRAKASLSHQILPEADGYIGQRFHDEEHDVGRRGRSSKISKIALTLGIEPNQIILLDDSIPNCRDCVGKGSTPILCKAMTDSEKINGKLEDIGLNRITDFNDYGTIYRVIADVYVKQKKLRR